VGLTAALFATGMREVEQKPGLTIAVPWAGQELDQFKPVLAAFEQKEGVKVKAVTYRAEDLSSILPAQFEAGQTLADIIFMWDWWVKKNPQHAVDLSDVWNPQKSALITPAAEAAGKIVAAPYVMAVKPGFWYRKSFFQANGLSAPNTADEFTALLRKIGNIPGISNPIVTGDGVGWPISDVTEHFIIAIGGAELQRRLIAGQVSWTDPQVRRVFSDYLIPLLNAGAFSDPIEWTQAVPLWWSGEYALYFMGNWITGMVDDPSDLGVFPLPGTKAIVSAPDWAFIPKYGDNVAEAKKLLSYMLSKEGQTVRAQQGGKFVIRNDIPASTYPKVDQMVAAVVSKMQTTVADLDDSIGGDWQRVFWDQLKLLWVSPSSLNQVLSKLQSSMP
jgi:multiple sugar transport system substrate-binding protein